MHRSLRPSGGAPADGSPAVVKRAEADDSASRPVRVPWRFSLGALAVLIALMGGIFGLLRDSPVAAMDAALVVLFLWISVARFLEFRRSVAERRDKKLAATLTERKNRSGDER